MMRTRLKICCISSRHEAQLAIRAGVDALGPVGGMPSGPGVIAEDAIRAIALEVAAAVSGFLLTQDRTADAIARHVGRCAFSTVQIVNHVDPEELGRLRAKRPWLRIVQVIHVEGADALELLGAYERHVHTFLLDSGSPGAAVSLLGGTGRVHNWSVSAEFVQRSVLPVFLAGGLTPENTGEAIRVVRPYGLNSCSGIRTDGLLHENKLQRYVDAVHGSATSSPLVCRASLHAASGRKPLS